MLTRAVEIPLCPEELKAGEEVRVVGSDDGERLQVLSGTVALVDREVPDCDEGFSDENTFYAMASTVTSEGSSGSPVLNVAGHCVALNVATSGARSGGYFLPLEHVAQCLA